MFEKMLILSKKIDAPVQKRQKRSDTYIYKDHIQVAIVRRTNLLVYLYMCIYSAVADESH